MANDRFDASSDDAYGDALQTDERPDGNGAIGPILHDGEDRPGRTGPRERDPAHNVFQADPGETGANQRIDDMRVDPALFFEQALDQTRMAIALADPHQKDAPLTFVNSAFEQMTGYTRAESVGRNCRFLQGPDTDQTMVAELSRAIRAEETCVVELLNYRKDGSAFWNALHVGPIYDKEGRLQHYYGSQWNVSDMVRARREAARQEVLAEELQHRLGNLFSVVSSIVRLSAQGETDARTATAKASERILALGRAHTATIAQGLGSSDTLQGADRGGDLRTLVETVLEPYRFPERDRVRIEGEAVAVPGTLFTPLGLAMHELATNAVKYGALARAGGGVRVGWKTNEGGLEIEWRERGGPSPPDGADDAIKAGSGTRILNASLGAVGVATAREWSSEGLTVRFQAPHG